MIAKNKKALAISTTLILTITILLSFGILLYAFNQITEPIPSEITKNICKASIESKALLGTELKCKTEYKCLTMGGKCLKGYEEVKVKNEEEMKKEIAETMKDCWWLLGEGKLDFFDESSWKKYAGIGVSESSCIVCTVIRFDEKSKGKELDFISYLTDDNNKIPNQNISYIQYFTGSSETILEPQLKAEEKISTNQDYAVIFMGIKGDELKQHLLRTLGLEAGAGVITGKALSKIGIKVFSKAALRYVALPIAAIIEGTSVYYYWQTTKAASIRCDGNTGGCFALLLVPYEAGELAKACQNFESIP